MGSIRQTSVRAGDRVQFPVGQVHRHFERNLRPERTALVHHDEANTAQVTFEELNRRSNRLGRAVAQRCRQRGPNSDQDYIVAVCMRPSHSTITTLLACMKAGAAYVPLEPSFPQGRVTHILRDARPVLVIYDHTVNPSVFAEGGVEAISYEDLSQESRGHSSENLDDEEQVTRTADSIAIVLYTSGSTGIPKGVRIPHVAICNRLWWQFRQFPYAADELACVSKTSLTFVDSVSEIWGALLQGRTLIILPKATTVDPQKLVAVLNEYEVQRLILVPTLLRSILMYLSLNRSENSLQKLKLWVSSGETLTKDLAKQFFSYFGSDSGYRLCNFYGSTEVMGDATYYVLENENQLDLYPSVPIGVPLDNCCVYIVDEERKPVACGERGEMWVSGLSLAAGYVSALGQDKWHDNPHANHPDYSRLYRTGDYGVVATCGEGDKEAILYTGRTDSQVKIRGHRIDLQEVQAAVSAVHTVDKSVVLCYGCDTANPEILAFVTLKPEARSSAQLIEKELQGTLTQYMVPQVLVIESIPLLVNGKVDRQALLKSYENTNNNDDTSIQIEIDYTGVAPEDKEKAEVLFKTVGEVVGRSIRSTVSCSANFYQLGGNSLNSIYTITRLRDQGYFIDISEFLSADSLGQVLARMSRQGTDSCGGSGCGQDRAETSFKTEPLADRHQSAVIHMVVTSFYEKADLEQWLRQEIHPRDYEDIINACWANLLEAGLSIVLTRDNEPVAVALNFDARREPDIELHGGLARIMGFLEHVEGPVRDDMLPPGEGAILHSFMMATSEHLSASDNVRAIRALEDATYAVGKAHGFQGVFTTNTSPLTQQLGHDVLGFQTMLDYQVNQYTEPDGQRPFGQAPDDQRAIVCWKPIQ